MSDPERVQCPVCGAAVKPSEILRADTDTGDWIEGERVSEDPRIGPLFTRIVRETVTGCTHCGSGLPN